MAEILSVRRAAVELELSDRRVRALIEAGQLPAERVGRSWAVSRQGLDRFRDRARSSGRPLNPRNSWALLALLAGHKPEWVRADVLSRLRRHRRDPEWLVNVLYNAKPRSRVRSFWMPEEDRVRLHERAFVRSGLWAADAVSRLDIIPLPDEPIDAYVSEAVAEDIERLFAPERSDDDPNVILRVPELPWVLNCGIEAPLSVVAADLLKHRDSRVRRAAEEAIRGLTRAG